MKEVPVLVVGGGAAGTMLTLELARRGVKPLTVDRLPKASETSNAITVHARLLEIFERIDKRLADRFLERGIRNSGYVQHFVDRAGKRREVRRHRLPRPRFALQVHSREPPERDRAVLARVRERALRRVDRMGHGMRRRSGGRGRRHGHARDGRQAPRRALPLPRSMRRPRFVRAPRARPRAGAGRVRGHRAADHGRVLGRLPRRGRLDPLLRGHRPRHHDRQAAGRVLPDAAQRRRRTRESEREAGAGLHAARRQAFRQREARQGRLALEVAELRAAREDVPIGQRVSRGRLRARALDDGRAGHELLHAGRVQPRLEARARGAGQGAGEAARHVCDRAPLDSGAGDPGRVVVARDPRGPRQGRRGACGEDRGRYLPRCARDSLLGAVVHVSRPCAEDRGSRRDRRPAVGDRAPDADLGRGRALYDLTRHTRFTLLLLEASADRQPARAELLRHVTKRFQGLVDAHVVSPSPSVAEEYGSDTRDRLFLLRPDGHVGFRCLASEAERLEAHLADTLSV